MKIKLAFSKFEAGTMTERVLWAQLALLEEPYWNEELQGSI